MKQRCDGETEKGVKNMTTDEYSFILEETLAQYMDDTELLDSVLRALNEEKKIDIFLYIARMNDIPVPDRD